MVMQDKPLTYILVRCPRCKGIIEKWPPGKWDAVSHQDLVRCDHCNVDILIYLWVLDRDAQQRNGAAGAEDVAPDEPCGNCGTFRTVRNGVIEKCRNCGDDDIELVAVADVI